MPGLWYNDQCLDGNGGVLFCAASHNPIVYGQSALCETISVLLHLGNGGNSHGGRCVMLTNEDWAYWAGFFDGDGCVSLIHADRAVPHLYVTFTQANQEILHIGQEQTGLGRICIQRRKNMRHKHDTYYSWYMTGNEAAAMLKNMLPYLKNKAEQARIAIGFQEYKRQHNHGNKQTPQPVVDVYAQYVSLLQESREQMKANLPIFEPLKKWGVQLSYLDDSD